MSVARFPLLSRLVEEAHRSNLIERMYIGRELPFPPDQQVATKHPETFKRKTSEGASGPI